MTKSNGQRKELAFAERLVPVADMTTIQLSARAVLEESLALYLKLGDKSESAIIPDSAGTCAACGRRWSLEQAVEYVLSRPHTPATSSAIVPVIAELTSREVEVLGLLAAGKSNREIAAELVLSIRTAERHIANIYEKLGAHGKTARAAATAFAFSCGLIPHQTNGLTHTIRISKYENDR